MPQDNSVLCQPALLCCQCYPGGSPTKRKTQNNPVLGGRLVYTPGVETETGSMEYGAGSGTTAATQQDTQAQLIKPGANFPLLHCVTQTPLLSVASGIKTAVILETAKYPSSCILRIWANLILRWMLMLKAKPGLR
jgi:hypothetical protein